jgi:hypothetical protein
LTHGNHDWDWDWDWDWDCALGQMNIHRRHATGLIAARANFEDLRICRLMILKALIGIGIGIGIAREKSVQEKENSWTGIRPAEIASRARPL